MDKPMPDCPKCGNNRQVWRNQITGLLTCHRLGCDTVIATINAQPHAQPCPCAWCRVDADNLSLTELADEAEREFNTGKTLPVERLCPPTREQKMRADLARAMGWTYHDQTRHWIDPLDSHDYSFPPNPFEFADDSRALVLWLAEVPARWEQFFRHFTEALELDFDVEYPVRCAMLMITAPLPVIAETAWLAIQPAK